MLDAANICKINLSPVYKIENNLTLRHHVQLWIKREDLLHPHVSGNKWRKLKYNLLEVQQKKATHLLTFGGAFSNHIAATAAAGQFINLPTIGIIRGEEALPLNPTLVFAQQCGMQFYFVDRLTYRQKEHAELVKNLLQQHPHLYLLPEGGTNSLAIKGCLEIIADLITQMPNNFPNYIATAVGTGGTISGVITGLQDLEKADSTQVMGFSALKGNFLQAEVETLLKNYSNQSYSNWLIQNDYHFGGYAKFTPELIDFIKRFKADHAIPLDPIYTGKMMFGIFDLMEKGYFPKGSHVLALHTGGLQGLAGFHQRFGKF